MQEQQLSFSDILLQQQNENLQAQMGAQQQPEPPKPTADLNLRLICRDCKEDPPRIIEDFSAGDLICETCGLVLGNRVVDTRSEWRTFANSDDGSDDPSRVGDSGNPLLSTNSLESTVISMSDGGTGRAKDLNKTQSRSIHNKAETNLLVVFKRIQTLGEAKDLPRVVTDSAKQLYKQAEEANLLKGKSLDAILAACIYIACMAQHVPRTFREICELMNVPKKEVGKCYKLLQKGIEKPAQQLSLDSFVFRFTSALDIGAEVRRNIVAVTNRVAQAGVLDGKSPISHVGACIYFVCLMSDVSLTARDIAMTVGCREATLKNAYGIIYDIRDQLTKGLSFPKKIDSLVKSESRTGTPAASPRSVGINE